MVSIKKSLLEKLEKLEEKEIIAIENLVDLLVAHKHTKQNGASPHQRSPKTKSKVHYSIQDLQEIAAQHPSDTSWTYTLLQETFPFEYQAKIEIIHNQLHIMPNPSEWHQDIVLELATVLKSFVKKNKLGKIIIAPFDVYLDENNVFSPDILYISLSRKEILDGKIALGAPDLVVEVISPANYKKLCEEKKEIYAQFGVQEYWEIYPKKQKCLVYVLQEGKLVAHKPSENPDLVKSYLLEGFELNIKTFFQELLTEDF